MERGTAGNWGRDVGDAAPASERRAELGEPKTRRRGCGVGRAETGWVVGVGVRSRRGTEPSGLEPPRRALGAALGAGALWVWPGRDQGWGGQGEPQLGAPLSARCPFGFVG